VHEAEIVMKKKETCNIESKERRLDSRWKEKIDQNKSDFIMDAADYFLNFSLLILKAAESTLVKLQGTGRNR
jgi:hypothetical protein